MKQYTKPKVSEGEWVQCAAWANVDGVLYEVWEQKVNGTYQDHYAIYINGKRQRKTYFGESAHHEVARAYNDLVGWKNTIFGDEL